MAVKMKVSVRDLKNHLSKYLHIVAGGEQIIVTSHHVPLAKLVSIPRHENENLQSILQIEGISWNGKKPIGGEKRPSIQGKKTVSDYVLEDRK